MEDVRRAESVSLQEFSSRLNRTVQTVLSDNRSIDVADVELKFLPIPGIIGFWLRDLKLLDTSVAEFADIAGAIVKELPGNAAAADRAIVLNDGGITVGFFPRDEFTFRG